MGASGEGGPTFLNRVFRVGLSVKMIFEKSFEGCRRGPCEYLGAVCFRWREQQGQGSSIGRGLGHLKHIEQNKSRD